MQIGVNLWVWESPVDTAALERLLPHVAALGFDWLEIPLETPGELDEARAAAMIRAAGLGVSVCAAMGPDRDLVHPDAAVRASGASYVRRCVEAAAALGAPSVVGPLYSAVGRTWQMSVDERARVTELLVDQLAPLAAYAADHGVCLCVEPLNRFETSFLNLASQAIEVVDRVGGPGIGLLLDTFHMNIEERSLGDAIRAAGPRLRHLHACENDRGAPGAGHLPWGEVAAALRDVGYRGPVVIESFTGKVQSIARAAAIWRPLAASQDALASEGLAFLRRLLA
jgi:D-psicose/D-tagatose/L-ribulose 3-epimerase